MSDEYRQIEVVQVGSGPPKPARPPRTVTRTELLLTLLVVGIFLVAGGVGYAAWTAHVSQQDTRLLNCVYVSSEFNGSGGVTDYKDLPKAQRKLVDRFDCDVPGR